jgi:hypothetical protein
MTFEGKHILRHHADIRDKWRKRSIARLQQENEQLRQALKQILESAKRGLVTGYLDDCSMYHMTLWGQEYKALLKLADGEL